MDRETVKSDKFKIYMQTIRPLLNEENNPALQDILAKAGQKKKTISLGAVNDGNSYIDSFKIIYEKSKELFDIFAKKGDNKFLSDIDRDNKLIDKFNEIATESHKFDYYFKNIKRENTEYFDERMFKLAKDVNNIISSFDNYTKIFENYNKKIEDNEKAFNNFFENYSEKQTELAKQSNIYKIQQLNDGKKESEIPDKNHPLNKTIAECYVEAKKFLNSKIEAKAIYDGYADMVNDFQELKKAEFAERENQLFDVVLNSKKKIGFDSSLFKDVAGSINEYKADKTNEEKRNKLLTAIEMYIEKRDVGNSRKSTEDGQKRLDAIKELRLVMNREKTVNVAFFKERKDLPGYVEKFVVPKSMVEFNLLNKEELNKITNLINPEKHVELKNKFTQQEIKLLNKLVNPGQEKKQEKKQNAVPEKKKEEPVIGH